MEHTNHSLFSFALYILLCFCLSCIQCIQCYGLKIFAKQNPKQSQICFGFLVIVLVMVVSSLSFFFFLLVTCEGLFLPRIATWKNPLNNIYTLMSGVVVVVMRACKAKIRHQFCMKQFVKATHHCGPQGMRAGGGMGCFARMG
jgi:hypothetical protein